MAQIRVTDQASMRVAIYARISTADKDQNPETQLLPLREFSAAQVWAVAGEFTDRAPATDLRARTAWRELLDQAARRRVDLVLVWRIDRAFRSVLDAATTLEPPARLGSGPAQLHGTVAGHDLAFRRSAVLHHGRLCAAGTRDSGRARSSRHGARQEAGEAPGEAQGAQR